MIKIAVTGASGFIGQHILNYLNNLPVEVVAITRSKHENLPKLVNGLWVEMDMQNLSKNMFSLMGRPVVVSETTAHLRAMKGAGMSMACSSTNDWVSTIKDIVDNKTKRNQYAKKGFAYASRVNSEERIISLWDDLFDSIVNTKINKYLS